MHTHKLKRGVKNTGERHATQKKKQETKIFVFAGLCAFVCACVCFKSSCGEPGHRTLKTAIASAEIYISTLRDRRVNLPQCISLTEHTV